MYDDLMEIPGDLRNSLIKKGYSQAIYIQKARVRRSSVENAAIRLKHLTSGDIVSIKLFFKSKIDQTVAETNEQHTSIFTDALTVAHGHHLSPILASI
jgi:hypothetical protein